MIADDPSERSYGEPTQQRRVEAVTDAKLKARYFALTTLILGQAGDGERTFILPHDDCQFHRRQSGRDGLASAALLEELAPIASTEAVDAHVLDAVRRTRELAVFLGRGDQGMRGERLTEAQQRVLDAGSRPLKLTRAIEELGE